MRRFRCSQRCCGWLSLLVAPLIAFSLVTMSCATPNGSADTAPTETPGATQEVRDAENAPAPPRTMPDPEAADNVQSPPVSGPPLFTRQEQYDLSQLRAESPATREALLDILSIERVESEPRFRYAVEGDLALHLAPSADSEFSVVSADVLYPIQRVDDSFWYISITDLGDKGYLDLSTVAFTVPSYSEFEAELLRDDGRFQRFGPLLVAATPNEQLVFEDSFYWEDSDWYQLVAAADEYFVLYLRGFEINRYLLYSFADPDNVLHLTGIPIEIPDREILVTCGRSFLAPDGLIIVDLRGEISVLYAARVRPEMQYELGNLSETSIVEGDIRIVYEDGVEVVVELDENNVPLPNPHLEPIPLAETE